MAFSKDFLWGAASAAYQVEGAYDEDGKVPGIWDALSEGHVAHGDNGNVACDHYHRYKEDIALMKEIGIKAYRFSISWPRVMSGPDTVNEKGLDFYRKLVAELKAAGIEPMVTLFHWNLPMWAHEQGGWRNPQIVDWFLNYAKVVVDALSGQVSRWMTFNEPACFIGLGYVTGGHAPFETLKANSMEEGLDDMVLLSKHVLLAHGRTVQLIRERAILPAQVGMALNGALYEPKGTDEEAVKAAYDRTFPENPIFFDINWWADPAILGTLPAPMQGRITDEELAVIHQKLDFFGYNSYQSSNYEEFAGPNPDVYPGMPRTAMGWPITPDALYWAAKTFYVRYGLPFLITENGMANLDFVMSDGKVHDPQRIEYMKGYISGLQRAAEEGVPMVGYTYWSIMDNFEWAEGYDKRFGLIYVDYRTQERTLKDSAYFYADVIRNNGI